MSIATMQDVDVRTRDLVQRLLEWDPRIDAAGIGVAVLGGVVTLTGFIDSYSAKLASERVAKRVRGVRAVANEIEVRLRLDRTDVDIATDVVRALELHSTIPNTVQAAVHHGRVTLTGRVDWIFQKRDAEKAVRHIRGVRNVLSYIDVAPRAAELDVRHRITEALHHNANVDAQHITVTVSGDTVVLAGRVRSWQQRDSAERAAADAPGVRHVDNRITVQPESLGAVSDDAC